MSQIIFDDESLSYVQQPVDCLEKCGAYDFANRTAHKHCEATFGPSICNAMVFIVGDGPNNAWAVEEDDGCLCGECGLVACKQCTHDSIDGTRTLCSDCALNERKAFEDSVRMDEALNAVERGLETYLELLATEADATKIKRSQLAFDRINDLVERVHSQLLPNIQRASGLQQHLPGCEAA